MKTKYAVTVALAAAVAAGGGYYWYMHYSAAPKQLTYGQQVEAAKAANAAGLSSAASTAAAAAAAAAFSQTYQGPGFSFNYPDSLKVGEDQDESTGALTVTAQDAATHVGFQIYVTPAADGGPLTAERIQAELPEIGAKNFQSVSLDGALGLAFAAEDASFGESIQIWLTRGGYLYQVSTYSNQGPLLSKVLGTWKWVQ